MRIDPAEIPELPFPAALVDATGALVSATPEWRGAQPGCLGYHTGVGHLLVGAASPTPPGLELLMTRLLAALAASTAVMGAEAALRASVLLAGLRLVSGRPLEPGDAGTTDDVLACARAAIGMRAPALEVELVPEPDPAPVPAPATIALALVQFAVNAGMHEFTDAARTRRVSAVRIRVAPGPSFYVEWASERPAGVQVRTARHVRWRPRWGWGYVRLAADALGGVALPPGRTGEGTEAACFTIGSRVLTVPLACFEGGTLRRCTQSWEQETVHVDEGAAAEIRERLGALFEAAAAAPGMVVYADVFSARRTGPRIWAALPPEAGSQRVRDVLRGLDHERTLWAAPEPHATRVHALTVLLCGAVGEPWPTFDPSSWARGLPEACRALGLPGPCPGVPGAAVYPDPRVAAYLLAELGGRLSVRDEVVVYRPGGDGAADRLLAALDPAGGGAFYLTPPLERLFR